jgi:hypothetical protein
MTYDDKPKRKNLSPEELLQQAKLLHPENEVFVQGKSKILHPKDGIYANLYYQKGFPFKPEHLRSTKRNKLSDMGDSSCFGCLMWFATVFIVILLPMTFITNYDPLLIPLSFCYIPIIGLFIYITAGITWNVKNIATIQESDIQAELSQCIQHGQLIKGYAILVSNYPHPAGYAIIDYKYVSPASGKVKQRTWHFLASNHAVKTEDDLILLYLHDNCVIVL